MKSPIRVLLVEDSPIASTLWQRSLALETDIQVVGIAGDGKEALELLPKLNPDVICTDLHMPKMDGLALIQAVMATAPRPILVVSISVEQTRDQENIFRLLEAGAIDVFPKPRDGLSGSYKSLSGQLAQKIRVVAGVKVFTRRATSLNPPLPSKLNSSGTTPPNCELRWRSPSLSEAPPLAKLPRRGQKARGTTNYELIAIGASTGGPQTLQAILPALRADFPIPIVCVQHISAGFLESFVAWLNSSCALKIAIAQSGQLPRAGTVYLAPDGQHLVIDNRGYLATQTADPIDGHCPSVTALFESVARVYGRKSAGILLTGMGRDGARGLQAIAAAGGMTIAQNEASCIVFGMPKEAIALGAAGHVLSPQAIVQFLQQAQGN